MATQPTHPANHGFLGKLGADIWKVIKFVGKHAPEELGVAAALYPADAAILGSIAGLIAIAEHEGEIIKARGTKLDKLREILPDVKAQLAAANFLAGKQLINPELFEKAATEITNGIVDLLKSYDENPSVIGPPTVAAPQA